MCFRDSSTNRHKLNTNNDNMSKSKIKITKVMSRIKFVTILATASFLSGTDARSERDVLESFYNSTEGPRWKKSSGWMKANKNICEWHGITCVDSLKDSGMGVQSIRLDDNSLIGSGTTEIFELPFLKRLHIANNYLNEFSFENIQLAASLETLDVSNNGIKSLDGIGLAGEKLLTIDLSKNRLTGSIPEEIFSLSHAKKLYLGHNQFVKTIPHLIGSLTKVEVLELSGNSLTGTIPDELGNLHNLKELYLGDNLLTGHIPSQMEWLQNLEVLSISRVTRNQEEGKHDVLSGLLPAFVGLASLMDLDLAGNLFTGNLPSRLLKDTTVGSEKITINLHDNELTGSIPGQYADRFDQLFLDVTGNHIDEIPSRLCEKKKWMGGDVGVFGCDAILCPKGTANFEGRQSTANSTCVPCLELIDSSSLGHTECYVYQVNIEGSLTERQILNNFYDDLDGDNWSENTNWKDDKVDICDWFGVICRSDTDEIKTEGIEQSVIDNINTENKVIGISLPSNRLTGTVSKDIHALPGLVSINLGRNAVHFPIANIEASSLVYLTLTNTNTESLKGISKFSSLRALKADRNEMTGRFPSEIFKLNDLNRLDLSFNFFTGTLPTEIGNLSALKRIHLYGNSFTNTIPNEIGNLSQLVTLDLSENDFSGFLPTELNNLSKLKELAIHQTAREGPGLNGPLLDFSNLGLINKIALDSNEFTGEIPETFLSGIIDKSAPIEVGLSWNNFVGTLPATLDAFEEMNIELVGNKMTGIAPELCDNVKWMDGLVEAFQCDAIMCPSGTYNNDGLAWTNDDLCEACVSSEYYGSVYCEALAEPDVTTERDILEQIFYDTGGRTWNVEGNWTIPWIPICSWEGVSCFSDFSDADSDVESINLEGFGLSGSIPSAIYDLPALKYLIIGDNDVDISFDGIQNATTLEVLSLKSIGLSSIEGIEYASNLKDLDVSENFLAGTLPEALFELRDLRKLNVAYNSFTGTFPRQISELTNLEHLNCFQNMFVAPLPRSIASLSKLKELNFGENQLDGPIPKLIQDMTHLQEIDLSAQSSDGRISGKLLDFAQFPKLKRLNLGMNALTGQIPETFLSQSNITDRKIIIELSFNHISGAVPKSLDRFKNLSIDLIGNQITEIPEELCDDDNGAWMDGEVDLFKCDAILCPVGTTNKFGRRVSAEHMCTPCPSGFTASYMGSIQCLDAPQIHKITESEILIDFYKATDGDRWKKRTNWMDKDVEICEWFGVVCGKEKGLDHNGVVELRLPNNNINQSPPQNLFNLPYLNVLDLSNNALMDITFSGIENAENLEILILAGTRMSSLNGISSAISLKQLNIAGNLVAGQIPNELYNLGNLTKLYLANNNFEGPVDPKISKLSKLRYFYCSNNNLSGSLPSEIGKLTRLTNLDLSENKFTGNLPISLGNLIKLESLYLNHQRSERGFSGPLLDFRTLENLTTLFMRENSVSGTIPTTLLADSKNKNGLIKVDFSFNELTGGVPIELRDFNMLDINLVGNEFNDLPPELCDENSGNSHWMRGNVGLFQCSAILCPAGQYNAMGRQVDINAPCTTCKVLQSSPLLGNTKCDMMAERDILKKLFEENGGENWVTATNWNDDDTGICLWYGVSCSPDRANDDEGVTSLELNYGDDQGIGLIGHIPTQLFDLPMLKTLNLKGNQIDIDFTTIAENDIVEVLYLSNTNITSIEGIDTFSGLKEVHLTDTGATGNIDNLFEMKQLTYIYVSYNHLSGSLSRIGELHNLVKFFAINNNISGYIPPTIGALTELNSLALSGNFITGNLPTAMNGLTNLEEFANFNDLARGPGLTGKLIDFSGTKLQQLILSQNMLTGNIPKALLGGTDEDAEGLMIWLSYNQLTGAVPSELDRFDELDLVLEGNQITSLPNELCDGDNQNWMRGNVEYFGCDAILCPVGTYNPIGRQKHDSDPCVKCPIAATAQFMGSVNCETFSERLILKELFLSTGGATWKQNGNWTSDSEICDWFGITCSSSSVDNDSEVIGIDLSRNNLNGEVPTGIFLLPHLKHLNLRDNKIDVSFENVPFPKSLTEIALSKTELSSVKGIRNARSLKSLHLINTNLSGTFPVDLYSLTELKELHVSYNALTGTLSTDIGNLEQLEIFTLLDNKMHGYLPATLGNLKNLKELVLSENHFTGLLPSGIANLENLVTLSIFKRNGEGVGLSGSLPSFSALAKIEKIVLDYNSFTGTIPSDFLASADTSQDIEIGLSWNHLTGQVPVTLDKFKSLDIALAGNMISELPKEFCDNIHWMGGKVGQFSCDAILCPKGSINDFGRQVLERDPCEKCELSSSTPFFGSTRCILSEFDILEKLYNQCNGYNWKVKDGWPDPDIDVCEWDGISCGPRGHVTAILLGANNLQGPIPKETFDLPYLTSLWLYSNPIQFSFHGIENARMLESLLIDSTGTTNMDGLEGATHLTELGLRFNDISGSIPTEIANLRSLQSLRLSENNLSGIIPSFLESNTNLMMIRLGSNNLSGPLPSFAKQQYLYNLDLSDNQLTGTIPNTFLQEIVPEQIIVVDLSSNVLSGEVPASLARLDSLTLYIRDNEIENIPSQLCKKRDWNEQGVEKYGCEAIACPPGTYNAQGRQKSSTTPCIACGDAKFYGSVTCNNVLSDDKVEFSIGWRQNMIYSSSMIAPLGLLIFNILLF